MDPLTGQRTDTASEPTQTPRNFDFPTLNGDGSVSDLIETHPPPGQRTPPAALSSLAHKMDHSATSLDDGQYDMVDDAVSNDGETASIASDTDDFEDDVDDAGNMTPDDTGSVADDDEPHPAPTPSFMLSSIQLNKARLEYEAAQKQEKQRNEDAMDSFLSEDLETPRQSTINRFPRIGVLGCEPTPQSGYNSAGVPIKSWLTELSKPKKTLLDIASDSVKMAYQNALPTLFVSLLFLFVFSRMLPIKADDVSVRCDALSTSLVEWTNSTDAAKTFNIEHLLQIPQPSSTNATSQKTQAIPDVHFQGAAPNYIIVSLPNIGRPFPQPQSVSVLKGDKKVASVHKKLIEGVYGIAVDTDEAYGIVTVSMPCSKPLYNVTVSHNFGRRYLHLQKAQKELTKTVNKDVAVARKAAKSLTDLFQLELGASVAATKNVTTQLALHVSRDLQVFANTAASVFGKAVDASEQTAQHIVKDLAVARRDIIKAGNDAKQFVTSLKEEVSKGLTKSVTEPLVLSRERALMLKDKLLGRKTKERASCKRGCSKAGKICKAGKTCKACKSNTYKKSTPSKQLKEQTRGKLRKHAQKPAQQVVV